MFFLTLGKIALQYFIDLLAASVVIAGFCELTFEKTYFSFEIVGASEESLLGRNQFLDRLALSLDVVIAVLKLFLEEFNILLPLLLQLFGFDGLQLHLLDLILKSLLVCLAC